MVTKCECELLKLCTNCFHFAIPFAAPHRQRRRQRRRCWLQRLLGKFPRLLLLFAFRSLLSTCSPPPPPSSLHPLTTPTFLLPVFLFILISVFFCIFIVIVSLFVGESKVDPVPEAPKYSYVL